MRDLTDASMPHCPCYVLTPRVDNKQILTYSHETHPAKNFNFVHSDTVAKYNQLIRALCLICFLTKVKARKSSSKNENKHRVSMELPILQRIDYSKADITPASRHQADSQGWVMLSIKDLRSKATRINYGGQNKFMREI